jgi:hypothetical protein
VGARRPFPDGCLSRGARFPRGFYPRVTLRSKRLGCLATPPAVFRSSIIARNGAELKSVAGFRGLFPEARGYWAGGIAYPGISGDHEGARKWVVT